MSARSCQAPTIAETTEILAFCDALLDVAAFDDYCPNGLQVPGAADVELIVSGVSARLELFEAAIARGAQMVLVHHGLFWDKDPRWLTPVAATRLKALLGAEINLLAYHLPLDAHSEIGNNALLADGLQISDRRPFGDGIGVAGRLPEGGLTPAALAARITALCAREPARFAGGRTTIETIAIVSGGAASAVTQAVAEGLDAFLTGEPSEPLGALAAEAGIEVFTAGHHATETFGVRRLGEAIAEHFGIAQEFVEIPNPV